MSHILLTSKNFVFSDFRQKINSLLQKMVREKGEGVGGLLEGRINSCAITVFLSIGLYLCKHQRKAIDKQIQRRIFFTFFIHARSMIYTKQLFKHPPHKMVKYTQTTRRQNPRNCLSVFDHFVRLALKVTIWDPVQHLR